MYCHISVCLWLFLCLYMLVYVVLQLQNRIPIQFSIVQFIFSCLITSDLLLVLMITNHMYVSTNITCVHFNSKYPLWHYADINPNPMVTGAIHISSNVSGFVEAFVPVVESL